MRRSAQFLRFALRQFESSSPASISFRSDAAVGKAASFSLQSLLYRRGGQSQSPIFTRLAHFMTFPPRHRPSYQVWSGRWRPDASKVLWSIIAANGAVYLLWRVDPHLAAKHFVVSLESLRSGRLWTLLTASFSQQDTGHLASNMITLYFFGSDIGRAFGGPQLLVLYLVGGIVGSLAHCAWSYYREKKMRRAYWRLSSTPGALGASAAVNSVMVVDILLQPTRTILLYGIIPLPAALLGLLWLWNDLGGALGGAGSSSIAHAGHLGGASVGLAFWLAFRRGLIRPRSW